MVCRHIGLLFGTRLYRDDFPASSDLLSTRYRICLRIYFFHSRERIRKHPDSLDAPLWTEALSSRKKLWIKKYQDTCGQG